MRTFLEHDGIDGEPLDAKHFNKAPLVALLSHALNQGDDDPVRWGLDAIVTDLEVVGAAIKGHDLEWANAIGQVQAGSRFSPSFIGASSPGRSTNSRRMQVSHDRRL